MSNLTHGTVILRLEEKDSKKMLVSVKRATNLDSKDANGKSDPYCVLHYRGKKHKTKVIKKNLNPTWDQDFELNDCDGSFLHVEVYDWDLVGKDDFIGEAYIDLIPQKKKIELAIPLKSKSYYKELNDSPATHIFDPVDTLFHDSSEAGPSSKGREMESFRGRGRVMTRNADLGMESNAEFKTMRKQTQSWTGLDIFREGAAMEAPLKPGTSEQVKSTGVWGAINPDRPFQHAGSLEIKLLYKPKTSALWVGVSRGEDLDSKDENGYSDPYVVLQLGKMKKKTAYVRKNLNPVFNEEFEFDILDSNMDLKVQVWDWDRYKADDAIGGCLIPINVLPEEQMLNTWVFLNTKFSLSWSSLDPGMVGVLKDEKIRQDRNTAIKRNDLLKKIFSLEQRTESQNKFFDNAQEEYIRRKNKKAVSSQFPKKAFFFFIFQFLLFVVLNVVWTRAED
uniref:C2 domain-containing protein n=1 Tax=Paramoeba aestuarina TaxID=180227 RepID=A0A7S4L6M3_9EUKA